MLLFLWLSLSFSQEVSSYGKIVDQCVKKENAPTLWLFKQWHLVAKVDTSKGDFESHVQFENQKNLYLILDHLIKQKKLVELFAEGCEGEINERFSKAYNGWDYQTLKARSSKEDYSEILTHVPLKLEAKYQDRLTTTCADDDELIKKHSLSFSDAKGVIGFYSRIEQYKNSPKKLKPYLDGAKDVFDLPKYYGAAKTLKFLKKKLVSSVETVMSMIEARNKVMVKKLTRGKNPAGLVVGGLHIAGIKKQLEKKGFNCFIYEPTGYKASYEKLVNELRSAIERI